MRHDNKSNLSFSPYGKDRIERAFRRLGWMVANDLCVAHHLLPLDLN